MAYVTMTSILSGTISTRLLDIDEDQYQYWKLKRKMGMTCKLVQDEFPHLNPSDRDFLLMGTTQREWDHMYSEPEPEPVPEAMNALYNHRKSFASYLGKALGVRT
jgi:hypothetical protein